MRPLAAFFAVAALCCAVPLAAQEAVVSIPGTGVSFAPPDGFQLSSEFGGVWNTETASSIVVTEMPAEASEMAFDRLSTVDGANSALASQSIIVDQVMDIESPDGDFLLLHGFQTKADLIVEKWIALLPRGRLLLVMFNLTELSTLGEEDIRSTLASLQVERPATLIEKLGALPFTFQPCPAFPVVDVVGGLMVMMTETGTLGDGGRGMVLRYDGSDSGATSQRELALGFLGGAELKYEAPATFGDGEGYHAEIATSPEGTYAIAYTFAHQGYSVMVTTIATEEQRQATRDCLAEIAASFTAKSRTR